MRILQSRQFLDWQQFCSKAWRPPGQFATHHLFLGHCCTHRPAAQLMPEKSRRIHFCISKLTENPAAAVFTAETMLFSADENSSPSSGFISIKLSLPFLPSLLSRCQLVQPRQLPATDLFCRLGRLLVVLVTPFCLLTAPHCSTSSLRSGSTIATTTGSFRCRCRCRHHVKSPRVSRNCCLLRPFAAARPTSVQHRPALAQLQQPSAIWGLAACSRFM